MLELHMHFFIFHSPFSCLFFHEKFFLITDMKVLRSIYFRTIPVHVLHRSGRNGISSAAKTDQLIFNSASKEKMILKSSNPPTLTWYCCGPTVYDSSHIGHAFSYMQFDLIRRVLENFKGMNVVFVMNITDIDDKIINRANQEGRNWEDIATTYEKDFFGGIQKLGIKSPSAVARISQFIPQTVAFVQELISRRMAYVAPSGSVYFDVETYQADAKCTYGKLRQQVVDPDSSSTSFKSEKRNLSDFALWKGSKPGEPSWPVPFSSIPGRPGWHIECSTVASHFFGSQIDIHSGGIDLMFPHHENEEAQSCAYHGVENWVRYWVHSGHLLASDNRKMSKSLQNFVSIQDFLKKYSGIEWRMFCMGRHYRSGRIYSDEDMKAAMDRVRFFTNFCDNVDLYVSGILPSKPIPSADLLKLLEETPLSVKRHLADDFNFPGVLDELEQFVSVVNKHMLGESNVGASSGSGAVLAAGNFMESFFRDVGLILPTKRTLESGESASGSSDGKCNVSGMLDSLVKFRSNVRVSAIESIKTKEVDGKQLLKHCDSFREELLCSGVKLEDHGKLSSWKYIKGSPK